jgi:hypothetical protein
MKKYVMWVSKCETNEVAQAPGFGPKGNWRRDEKGISWTKLIGEPSHVLYTNPHLRRAIYFRSASFLEMELMCQILNFTSLTLHKYIFSLFSHAFSIFLKISL